jgi:ubiquinone/menaquinone biosynthesis C-methylase UbiE
MTNSDAAFTGSIPQLYDLHLGPLLFQPYAEDLAERLMPSRPGAILETAAGTGIVTRTLAKTLPEAVITATDLNQAMLDHAARQTSARVSWRQADAQVLPFPDASFDAVICQFGVMFFPDKPRAFAEARRVLKPGGQLLFNVWDRLENNAVSLVLNEFLVRRYPKDPPQFLVRAPFGFFDIGTITGLLERARFANAEAVTVSKRSRAASVKTAVLGLCHGSPLRAELEAREATGLDALTRSAEEWFMERFGTGALDAPMQAHVFSAS